MKYSGFKVVPSTNDNFISLHKKVGKANIKIIFESQPPESQDDEEQTELPEQYQEYQEMMEQGLHDVTVLMYKNGENENGIVAEYAVAQGGLQCLYVGVTDNLGVSNVLVYPNGCRS